MTRQRFLRELGVFRVALFDWRSCLLSKIALLLGVSYLFVPIDLIPDRIPIIGHFDEFSFIVLGLVGSRGFVPTSVLEQYLGTDALPVCPGLTQRVQFALRVLRADFSNFFLLEYRNVDGWLVTAKNSGTHWLKFMLSCAMAEEFGVPPPEYASGSAADAIISHPRWPAQYPQMPHIGSSHSIPSIAFTWAWLARLWPHPPVVVLVRDITPAMRSNYLKWRQTYRVSPSGYMRGDPNGQRFVADLWWYIHFFNRWGDVARAQRGNVLIVRYEDLLDAPGDCLRRIAAHYRMRLGDGAIDAALRYVRRDAMRSRLDPRESEIVVSPDDARDVVVFAPSDEAFMRMALQRHLRSDFGYGYPGRDTMRSA